MKAKVNETFTKNKHRQEIVFQAGNIYEVEKIVLTLLGTISYYITDADIILNEKDFRKYFSVVREMGSIESALYQIQDMDDAVDKLADVTVDAIYEDDNSGYEMAKGILNTFADCETEKEYKIANDMLISICGYSIETLLSKMKEKEQSEEIER